MVESLQKSDIGQSKIFRLLSVERNQQIFTFKMLNLTFFFRNSSNRLIIRIYGDSFNS